MPRYDHPPTETFDRVSCSSGPRRKQWPLTVPIETLQIVDECYMRRGEMQEGEPMQKRSSWSCWISLQQGIEVSEYCAILCKSQSFFSVRRHNGVFYKINWQPLSFLAAKVYSLPPYHGYEGTTHGPKTPDKWRTPHRSPAAQS